MTRLKEVRTGALRGSKSRNKVSVGEPAEGSLLDLCLITTKATKLIWWWLGVVVVVVLMMMATASPVCCWLYIAVSFDVLTVRGPLAPLSIIYKLSTQGRL